MNPLFSFAIIVCLAANSLAVTIPTVLIGNPGNFADSTGYGDVGYTYRIAQMEVTNAQYVEFLNAVAKTDTFNLYDSTMSSAAQAGITRSGASGNYVYSVKPNFGAYSYADKPVVAVSWFDALRFVNWLHNGQPTGSQNAATTEDGAYTFTGASSVGPRNADAIWFLPNENEWYKAAYYDADNQLYYDYPTGTDLMPDNNMPPLDSGNSANSDNTFDPRPLYDVGSYALSASPYGTLNQGGNAWEWTETAVESLRVFRGGGFSAHQLGMLATTRATNNPSATNNVSIGFRVATVPEPSTCGLATIGVVALLFTRRQRRCSTQPGSGSETLSD